MGTNKLNRHMRTSPASAGVASVNMTVLFLNVLLAIAALTLLAYYVVQANTLAAFQYDISAHEESIIGLREVHHAISADVAEGEHLDRIAEYARSAGMVLASDASYVSIPESPLAGR